MLNSFSCDPACFEPMVSCETAGCVVLLESAKLSTSAAADNDDGGGKDGDRGPLGQRFIAGLILYHEGTRPLNLVVNEQMDLSHDELD
jgi:hypothetical protein